MYMKLLVLVKYVKSLRLYYTNIKLNLIYWNLKNSSYVGHTLKQNIPDEVINTNPLSKFTTNNLLGKQTSTFD